MGRKRKSEDAYVCSDDAERAIYPVFRAAANSLSQLYTLSMAQHRAAFHDGERHAMEKLYEWILRKHEEKARLTIDDIKAYIQHEINYGDDPSAALRSQLANQHLHNPMASPNSDGVLFSGQFPAPQNLASPSRSGHQDQSKNSVFLNTLSSPVRRSLHSFQPDQNPELNSPGNNQRLSSPDSNDMSMDMHSDSPPRGSY